MRDKTDLETRIIEQRTTLMYLCELCADTAKNCLKCKTRLDVLETVKNLKEVPEINKRKEKGYCTACGVNKHDDLVRQGYVMCEKCYLKPWREGK